MHNLLPLLQKLVILINAHHIGQYICFHVGSGIKLCLHQSIQVQHDVSHASIKTG